MKTQTIELSKLRTDGGTQAREEISNDTVREYAAAWEAGDSFPPIDVFYDGATYWIADGFHRFYGARDAKKKSIECVVHQGTVRDAILFAVGANRTNGMRRTGKDKRRAILILLEDEEWGQWSDRAIAEKTGLWHSLVGEVRREREEKNAPQLDESSSSAEEAKPEPKKRKGRDGKSRSVPKRKSKPADDGPHFNAPNVEAAPEIEVPAEPTSFDVEKIEAEQAAAEAEPVYDSLKAEVPEPLKKVFRLAGEFEKHRQAVSQIKSFLSKEIDGLAKRSIEPMFNQAKTDLQNLSTALKFAMPFCVCVYCKAKGAKQEKCAACKGEGWITKAIYEAAPEASKK